MPPNICLLQSNMSSDSQSASTSPPSGTVTLQGGFSALINTFKTAAELFGKDNEQRDWSLVTSQVESLCSNVAQCNASSVEQLTKALNSLVSTIGRRAHLLEKSLSIFYLDDMSLKLFHEMSGGRFFGAKHYNFTSASHTVTNHGQVEVCYSTPREAWLACRQLRQLMEEMQSKSEDGRPPFTLSKYTKQFEVMLDKLEKQPTEQESTQHIHQQIEQQPATGNGSTVKQQALSQGERQKRILVVTKIPDTVSRTTAAHELRQLFAGTTVNVVGEGQLCKGHAYIQFESAEARTEWMETNDALAVRHEESDGRVKQLWHLDMPSGEGDTFNINVQTNEDFYLGKPNRSKKRGVKGRGKKVRQGLQEFQAEFEAEQETKRPRLGRHVEQPVFMNQPCRAVPPGPHGAFNQPGPSSVQYPGGPPQPPGPYHLHSTSYPPPVMPQQQPDFVPPMQQEYFAYPQVNTQRQQQQQIGFVPRQRWPQSSGQNTNQTDIRGQFRRQSYY